MTPLRLYSELQKHWIETIEDSGYKFMILPQELFEYVNHSAIAQLIKDKLDLELKVDVVDQIKARINPGCKVKDQYKPIASLSSIEIIHRIINGLPEDVFQMLGYRKNYDDFMPDILRELS